LQRQQKNNSRISINRELENAVSRLQKNLKGIESSIQDKYLQHKLENLESTLSRDTYVFKTALGRTSKPLQNIVLIDYGGGSGFHSLLARELGIGTVIYNDILHHYCTLAEEIATTLGRQADYYVEDDIDALIQFCDQHAIKADVITSSDVLEHIYDIDDFLSKLHSISHEGTVIMHSSGANIFWYPWEESVSRLHRKVENESGEDVGIQSSCYDERMKIIREHAQNMSADRLNQLAADTRGLAGREIINAVDRCLKTGERPALIEHPTNTCNPQTGYWAERSMNPYYLQETLSFNGFDAKLLAGPWERGNTPIVRIIRAVLNFLIRISPTYMALHLTYYYCILGKYNGKSSREMHREHMYRHSKSPIVYIVALPYRLLSIFRVQRDWWKL
jgi:2-polyprenyl-3-methyl-5-hydroxy-6-metoxy-1,4-benzoquinol methylase